ncbi:MAG: hypothetical protein ACHQF2_06165 [Flavobacteriales bacterium]
MKKKPDIFFVGVLFLMASGAGLIIASNLPDKNIRNTSTLLFSMGALAISIGLLEIVRKRNRQKNHNNGSPS